MHPKYANTEIESSGFTIGNLVDDLLINENIENKYKIVDEQLPTGLLLVLYEHIKNIVTEKPNNKFILEEMDKLGLYSNIKDEEKRLNIFKNNKSFTTYIDLLFEENKIISTQDLILANKIVNSLKTNDFTKYYCTNKGDNLEIINQYEIEWNYLGEIIKSKLDKVIINHNEKTIQALDFKTTGEYTSLFAKSFIKYKYYWQASLYQAAIYYQITKKLLPDYTILPFKFVVETTKEEAIGEPKIFTISEKTLEIANVGGELELDNYTYNINGWHQAIEDKIWYDENGYEYPRDYIINKGVYKW